MVGGVELGDHSDHKGRPNLRELLDSKRADGWDIFGSLNY